MAKDPAFLFYSGDFLTGTTFMSNEETGQYIKILCLLHQHNGKLPRAKIEKVVGKLSELVLEKLQIDKENNLFNKRLMEETIKRNSYCSSRRKNILHRYKKPTHVEHMNKHMENENENENRDIIEKSKYGCYVLLTKEEHNKLNLKFGESLTESYIQKLDNYVGSKGKKYKSHYHTILVWADKDKGDLRPRPTQAQVNTMASMAKLNERIKNEEASV